MYVIAVDQSTSSTKVFLIDGQGEIVSRFSREHRQFYPKPGYVEHDMEEVWQNVQEGVRTLTEDLPPKSVRALAISNQRETTVFWDRQTGRPVCHAVVWQDVRGAELCESMQEHAKEVRQMTGLQLSPYYPAAKAASVLQSSPALRQMAEEGALCIGTVDSYLIYRLTGGASFCTDVSNASRTQLMNLSTLRWDNRLTKLFGIPMDCLPAILPSDGAFGSVCVEGLPRLPIAGVMGDSHAALFGQGCLKPGMAKGTYGTGSSVMMNVGSAPIFSENGLSSSVGFGFQGQICYVLEGNVTCCGDTLCWLRDQAEMLGDIQEAEALANSVESTEGVYLVPAFSGLGAPYFDGTARAILCGMNRGTTRAHIVRAALESMAYQDADILEGMQRDMGEPLQELRVDGGPTRNRLLMQWQATLLGCPVQRSGQSELSALGVGYMAGIQTGVYQGLDSIPQRRGERYLPTLPEKQRQALMSGWREAVSRCRSTGAAQNGEQRILD